MSNGSPNIVERALTHAAVSYAFGFLVVMAHTWSLGLPVIALVDPVYVWIGAPFALVAFCGAPIVTSVRRRAAEARLGIARAFAPATTTPMPQLTTEIAEALARGFAILPFSFLPWPFSMNVRIYRAVVRWLLSDTGEGNGRINALATALSAVFRFARLAAYLSILAALLIAYVWYVYPILPKAFGGGAPLKVRMAVSRSALPTSLLTDLGVQGTVQEGGAWTEPLTLLYSTSDSHYVRTRAPRTVSLSTSAVTAIVWLDADRVDVPPEAPIIGLRMSLHFEPNRASVSHELDRSLREFGARVRDFSTVCVLVEGHTDLDGHADYNLELSRLRVGAVVAVLQQAGVAPERIVPMPHGSTQPRAQGGSQAAKAQNRRVDLIAESCVPR